MRREDELLLTAYLDGVTELAPDERARVETLLRDEPLAQAEANATKKLLGRLRELPPAGGEPDWALLERRIGQAIAPLPTGSHAWWRRWRWLVPIGALATTAAVALLWFHHPATAPVRQAETGAREAAVPQIEAPPSLLWLDGEALDVGDLDPAALLDDLDQDARAALASESDDVTDGILPATDLGWIDSLDERAIDRAERWLARRPR